MSQVIKETMTAGPKTASLQKGSLTGEIVKYLILSVFTVIVLIPLYITFLNAFKDNAEIVRAPFSLSKLTLENFREVFAGRNANILLMYRNSILITSVSVVLVIVLGSMTGYYIARTTDRKSKLVTLFFLAGIMIPEEITLIPLMKMYVSLGLIGKIYGMFLFYPGHRLALCIFLYSKFIKTLPYELEESAFLDGANRFSIYWKIIFPLLKPCTATVLVFVGLFIWNDFMMPLYLLKGKGAMTITLGIFSAIGPYSNNWGLAFAFVVIAALPIVLLYLLMQKWFISGLTAGAVKG